MELVFFSILAVAVLGLNAVATVLVLRDTLSDPSQRGMQIGLIWLLPIAGALIVLAVHRPVEKHAGKYREESNLGDDPVFPRYGGKRSTHDGDGD